MQIKRVCVYCASSSSCDASYHRGANQLGRLIAEAGITLVYGGGAKGSMGHLADGALAGGGRVIGVIPQFMWDLEWAHRGLSELVLTRDMHERKRLMIQEVDAVIALPGGCGTFEELFEAMAWKRLGIYGGPIVLVNTYDFYRPAIELLEKSIAERFMDERHREMWTVVERPDQVLDAIARAPSWPAQNRDFAVI
ncbi:MAG TPA: TIGR00730 family Rossman fold protein [Candidatus Binataceae bacterium]|nr:TIGR00730 family Rossman fold protein [Candidatus Binataceae bacterium]